ncbi:MAG: hypothetical protein QGG46_03915 [Gammaproteobacteria bacterium]|nr:hypothetical protein [Gammaproteobacteria bacterium]
MRRNKDWATLAAAIRNLPCPELQGHGCHRTRNANPASANIPDI